MSPEGATRFDNNFSYAGVGAAFAVAGGQWINAYRSMNHVSEVAQSNLNRFNQAASELSETGQNNIRILRGWAKSKGWSKFSNPEGGPEKWGTRHNGKWHLKIKPEPSFRSGLDRGSNAPRFDAKLQDGGQQYINPFTGEIGGKEVGTHILLDYIHY